jgi:hypothetical protein
LYHRRPKIASLRVGVRHPLIGDIAQIVIPAQAVIPAQTGIQR